MESPSRTTKRRSVVAAAVLAVAMTAPAAWAHGRGCSGPDGDGGPGHGFGGGGVLMRLISPCRATCVDGVRSCGASARSDTLTCAQSTCDAQIQAARGACATDFTSPGCRDARTALITCMQPCRETQQIAASTCHASLQSCFATCGGSTTAQ